MDGPVEIKPRFVDPVVIAAASTIPHAPITDAIIDPNIANSSGSVMSSIYENKLIVLIVIVVILIISFISYIWLRKDSPPPQQPAQTISGAGGVNGVGGDNTAAPQTAPQPAPQSAPQPAPQTQAAPPTKEQLEAMLNKTKAAAAACASNAVLRAPVQNTPQPKTIPGSRSETDLMNIMGYNRTTISVIPMEISIEDNRVTDVTAEIESADEDNNEDNNEDNDDVNPWLQDDFGIVNSVSNTHTPSDTPLTQSLTLSPHLCSFILPTSRQCKNKPKNNGRCVKHGV